MLFRCHNNNRTSDRSTSITCIIKTTTQYVGGETRNHHHGAINFSPSSNKLIFSDDDDLMYRMKKVMPNNNQQLFNTRTFDQIRSYTTTANCLKRKEVSTKAKGSGNDTSNNSTTLSSTTTSAEQQETLKFNDYDSWNAQQVAFMLTSPKSIGGAGLSAEKVKPLQEFGFDGESLHNIIENINMEGIKYAIDQLKSIYNKNDIPQISETCQSVVFWVHKSLRKFTTVPSTFIQSVLDDFDKHVQTYSRNEKESVFKFNEKMKQVQLDKSDSPIYLYQKKEDTNNNNEITLSSWAISCDLGPTFPANKYDEHFKFITSDGIVHPVLALIEAPGTGKTYFAYHLVSKGYTVLIIQSKHKNIISNSLEMIFNISRNSSNLRGLLDSETKRFIKSYLIVADIIINARLDPKDTKKTNLYLCKYILNGGFKMVQEAYNNNYEQHGFSPQLEKVMFFIDEAHDFNDFDGQIPRTTKNTDNGNLLTLLTSNMRDYGGVVLTTTFASAVEGKIEKKISKEGNSKQVFEKFSYHFTNPLPILHAKQVTNFLDMFIDTSRKGHNNPDIWKLVATFLQGPTRRCEELLQQLYLELCKDSTPQFKSFTEFIYTNLCTLVFDRKGYGTEKIDNPLYKSLFYRLALLGEANLTEALHIVSTQTSISKEIEDASKFLLTHGLSYTFDYTNKIYKVVSPIERMRLLKTLQKDESKGDWFLNSHKQLSNIGDISPLSEVASVYFILNHFEFFKQQFPGTYLQNYYLAAKYYVEDSEVSKDSLNNDFKISSLLINTIHCNMKGFQTEKYPLTGNDDDLLPRFLVRPCHNAGPDVLGMLKRSSKVNDDTIPLCIPIVAAVTRKTGDNLKFKKNYATTDLSNLYYENLETNKSPPTNDLTLKERNSLNTAITDIVKAGKMLRILFHPNETFSNTPLSDRIQQYDHDDAPQIIFSDHAVLTKKGHCIYEISKNNSVWQNYLNNKNLSAVADVFQQ
ncbi:hypothetical protein FDP41_000022 [Naegleria fowleri]|uniref:Uncharacterized protein n=1 Tax=Naegleria fowleri TaxID=5763 RepID=A0A6A5C3K0_NAEFO|nr:uncharacterized protein FDP41_000022 [Naegleria fowleri]KAF0984983.1 hypothetical protein FDP41_000022 [Naegleria fowleri]